MPNLLIEIGVEELPVGSLDIIYDELAAKTRQKLADECIAFADVKVEATPRRIALFIESMSSKQKDISQMVPGPAYEKCYDAQGKSTAALQGFLRKYHTSINDVGFEELRGRKHAVLRVTLTGQPVKKIISRILEAILNSTSFPKLMRWESTGFRFPRPIRWIVALLDKKVIPLQIADVKSGNKSFGHRFLSPQSFTILKADWKAYIALLKKKHVYLSIATRETLVQRALKNRFGQKQIDEELVHMNAQLVEEPFFLEGAFSQEYLELPAEVLASCMKKNQKVFACCDAKGKMRNQFVAVMNGKRGGLAEICLDYENVLNSRLKDARYFHEMDTHESFERKKPVLAQLVYLGKLGSVLDKTERLEKLAPEFAKATDHPELVPDLVRVAALSKIDLVTHLVYEMPDLQGIVGREYALEAGEKNEVASAIGAQYLPKNLMENHCKVKKSMSLLGALFGIMDRLDLLIGALGSGIEPTGSQDPFALRRSGGLVVKLIRAFEVSFSLEQIFETNVNLYGNKLTKKEDLKPKFFKFLQERVVFETGVKPGTRPFEILQAVMRSSFEDIADVFKRFEVLTRMDQRILIKAAKVIQRTANMLKGYGKVPGEPKEGLLVEAEEKKLFELLRTRAKDITEPLEMEEYEKTTRIFADLFSVPLHDFFDHVLVNAEDTVLRENRMALVAKVNRLYTATIADLSALSRIDEG